jgi:uncharacterized protein (UPF0147 family)
MPLRCRRYLQVLEDPPDRRCANAVTELEKLALDPSLPHEAFSVASRLISVVISALQSLKCRGLGFRAVLIRG